MKQALAGSQPAIGAATILLVEDEAFVREVTGEVLLSAGYEVLVARNACEALRLYDDVGGEVALVVTDIILPGDTGVALAAALRRRDAALKVLFVSGYAEQLRKMNREECLAKPFSTEALLEKVQQRLMRPRYPPTPEEMAMPACVGA